MDRTSFVDRDMFMMFAGDGVAHQELCSDNWQLKPSVLQCRDDIDEAAVPIFDTEQVFNPNTFAHQPSASSSTTAPKPQGSGLIIRLPPLSSFANLSLTDKDRSVIPNDEEDASGWEYSDSETDESTADLVAEY